MQKAFCTISTQSHLYKVKALQHSLRQQDPEVQLYCLLVDGTPPNDSSMHWLQLPDIKGEPARKMQRKYRRYMDKLRWCFKPLLLHQLLQQGCDTVVYVDNDIWFTGSIQPIWEELSGHQMLLTPHDYPRDPQQHQNWLEANYRVGLYNAGFVGAAKGSLHLLQWWAQCCLYRCEKNYWRGLFDDQKYLDLLPVMDPGVKVSHHKGLNVASWNKTIRPREKHDGCLTAAGDTVVFVHFNPYTIREVIEGNDPLLQPVFDDYVQQLQQHKPGLTKEAMYVPMPPTEKMKLRLWQWLNRKNPM